LFVVGSEARLDKEQDLFDTYILFYIGVIFSKEKETPRKAVLNFTVCSRYSPYSLSKFTDIGPFLAH